MTKKTRNILLIIIGVIIIFLVIFHPIKLTKYLFGFFTGWQCTKEGEKMSTFPSFPLVEPECCFSLVTRKVLTPQFIEEKGKYVCVEMADVAVCTKCGNAICGLGENWCNCEKDCPKPPGIKVMDFEEYTEYLIELMHGGRK